MFHVLVPLASLRNTSLCLPAGLCSEFPRKVQDPFQTFVTQLSSYSWWAKAGFASLFFSFLHWWKEQENFASNDCHLYKLHKTPPVPSKNATYGMWETAQQLKVGVFAGFPTSITIVVQTS